MANIIEQRGFFWWLDEPDLPAHSKETSIPGSITITEDGQTTLQTDGPLCRNDEHADWSKLRSFPSSRRIGGLLATSGDYVLLEGLERTDFSSSDEAPQRQEFTAESCTKRQSAFPDDYEQSQFTELRVEMTGLEEWLDLDSIVVKRKYDNDEGTVRAEVSYKEHRISFPVFGGVLSVESLTTGANPLYLSPDRATRSAEFKQYFYIIFRPDSPANRQLMEYTFTTLEEFLALLLGTYYRLAWPTLERKEEPFDSGVIIYSQRDAPTTQFNRWFCWVAFERIRGYFGQLFQEWLIHREAFGAGFYLYVASLRNPHVYSEDRLFSLVSGMEALHRRWLKESESSPRVVQEKERVQRILNFLPEECSDRKWLGKRLARAHEPNLEARLLECLRQLPIQFAKGELETFAKTCANRRNDISHEGGPREDMGYNAFHQETSRLAEALDHLFHALLLFKIGLPAYVLFETLTKSWVAERRIKPALAEVGLHIQFPAQSENECPESVTVK